MLSTVLGAISRTDFENLTVFSSFIHKGIKRPKSTPTSELGHLDQVSGQSARRGKMGIGEAGRRAFENMIDTKEEQTGVRLLSLEALNLTQSGLEMWKT